MNKTIVIVTAIICFSYVISVFLKEDSVITRFQEEIDFRRQVLGLDKLDITPKDFNPHITNLNCEYIE